MSRCYQFTSPHKAATPGMVSVSAGTCRHVGGDLHERLKRLLPPAGDCATAAKQSAQPADTGQTPVADLLREWREQKLSLGSLDTSIRAPPAQDCSLHTRPVSTAAADIKARLDALLSQPTSAPGTRSAAASPVPVAHVHVAQTPACVQPSLHDGLSVPTTHPEYTACTPGYTRDLCTPAASLGSLSCHATHPFPHPGDAQLRPSPLQPTLTDVTPVPHPSLHLAEPSLHEASREDQNPCSKPCGTAQGSAWPVPTSQVAEDIVVEGSPAVDTAVPSEVPGSPQPECEHHSLDNEGQRSLNTHPDSSFRTSPEKAPEHALSDQERLRCSGPVSPAETKSHSPVCSQASSHLSETMEHILDGMFQSDSNRSSPCQSPATAVVESGSKPLSPPAPTDSPQRSRCARIMSCARSEVTGSVSSCNEDASGTIHSSASPCCRASANSDMVRTSCGDSALHTYCHALVADENDPCSATPCDVASAEDCDSGAMAAGPAAAYIPAAEPLPSSDSATISPMLAAGTSPLRYQSHCGPVASSSHSVSRDDMLVVPLAQAPTPMPDASVLRASCDDVCEGVEVATNGGRSYTASPSTPCPPSLPSPEDEAVMYTPSTAFSHEHCTAARQSSSADRYDDVDISGGQLHTCSAALVGSEPHVPWDTGEHVARQVPPWAEDGALHSRSCTTKQAPRATSPESIALSAPARQQGYKLYDPDISWEVCPWEEEPCFPLMDGISVVGDSAASNRVHESRQNDGWEQGGPVGAAVNAAVLSPDSLSATHRQCTLLPASNRLVYGSVGSEDPTACVRKAPSHRSREQMWARPGVEHTASLEDWLHRKGRLARWVADENSPVECRIREEAALHDGCLTHWPVGDASLQGLLAQDTQVFGPATFVGDLCPEVWESIHRVSQDLRDSSHAGE